MRLGIGKVKSLSQLYRWKEHVMRGGSDRNKFTLVAEYVLIKFQEALRKVTLEA